MSHTTIRISADAHGKLKALAEQTGEPMYSILEKAVEAYRRQKFLEEANQAYAALRNDPEAWTEELAERQLWEPTLADGLEGD